MFGITYQAWRGACRDDILNNSCHFVTKCDILYFILYVVCWCWEVVGGQVYPTCSDVIQYLLFVSPLIHFCGFFGVSMFQCLIFNHNSPFSTWRSLQNGQKENLYGLQQRNTPESNSITLFTVISVRITKQWWPWALGINSFHRKVVLSRASPAMRRLLAFDPLIGQYQNVSCKLKDRQ